MQSPRKRLSIDKPIEQRTGSVYLFNHIQKQSHSEANTEESRAVTGARSRNPKFQAPNPKQSQITNCQMFQNLTAHLPHSPLSLRILNIGICLGFGYCDLEFNVMNFKYVWLGFLVAQG
jgi:hypothetical protein